MVNAQNIAGMRRQYGTLSLDDKDIMSSPFDQFDIWFADAAAHQNDANAMVLSTVDARGYPDSRVLLLKGIEDGAFVFYTNYNSPKSFQIQTNPHASIVFYWSTKSRQVRIRGQIKRTSETQSDLYFYSRPIKSQISAMVSPQSQEISSRGDIEQIIAKFVADNQAIKRPVHWGGYMLYPDEFEFFQGRDDRVHDRVQYYRKDGQWLHRCLAP